MLNPGSYKRIENNNDDMVLGVLISLALVGALLFILMRIRQDASFSVLSWIAAALLVVILSFEINRLISNLEDHSQIDDYIASVYDCIDACLPYEVSGHQLTLEEAHIAAVALKTTMPSMSRYIRASDLEGKTGEAIADTLREAISKSVRRNTWNLVGWIALTIVLGAVLMAVFMENNSRGKTRSNRSRSEIPNRRTRYHSRRN